MTEIDKQKKSITGKHKKGAKRTNLLHLRQNAEIQIKQHSPTRQKTYHQSHSHSPPEDLALCRGYVLH